MPQHTLELVPTLRRELPWFALMAGSLVATFVFADVVVRRGILLPSLAAAGAAPPWVWAALYAPELVASVMIGWRLRSWALVLLYAGAAALLREGTHLALRWVAEPGADLTFASAATELAIALPLGVIAYALVFALAASSAREDGPLPERSRAQGRPGTIQR